MSDAGVAEMVSAATGPVQLDPFGYMPETASRIAGLGGPTVGHDPKYVFHTPYVEVARGSTSFTVRFQNLQAKRGTLLLQVNMIPLDGSTSARLVTTERMSIARVASIGGSLCVGFNGYRTMSFAIFGYILDDSDVTADGITVTLDKPPTPEDDDGPIEDARSTAYRSDTVRPAALILDMERPSFANPLSQTFTAKQTTDSAFKAWAGKLRADNLPPRKLWEQAYILQTLQRYGLLASGARALGFLGGGSAIPALMAQGGLIVTAGDPLPEGADVEAAASAYRASLRERGVADAETVERIDYQSADLSAPRRDFVNYDMIWSCGLLHRLGPAATVFTVAEAAMRCLRPGGLAVHTMDVALGEAGAHGSHALSVQEIERIALMMISRGHEIGRVRFDRSQAEARGGGPITSFGFIIRKALSPI